MRQRQRHEIAYVALEVNWSIRNEALFQRGIAGIPLTLHP